MSVILHKKTFSELTVDELYELLRIRSEVFVVEQDCVYQDMDGDDQVSLHLWLTEGDKVVALCRVCPAGTHMQEISIGRVITTERGKGYGKQIMREGIAAAREHFGALVIDIEAQEYAKGFYEQVGFRQSSEIFMLDGIPHIKMTWKEYPIETQRLRFRPWQESDAEALFKYAADPDVGPRAGWPPHGSVADSLEVIRKFFANDHTWALVLKETGEPIGCMGYYPYGESNIGIGENDAELGYWIAKPYWNQGLCTEALQAMIDWCFNEKGFQTLWSDFFVDNPASGRVMEKCGFRDTGEFNWCSHLYRGDERPVKVMRLDYAL